MGRVTNWPDLCVLGTKFNNLSIFCVFWQPLFFCRRPDDVTRIPNIARIMSCKYNYTYTRHNSADGSPFGKPRVMGAYCRYGIGPIVTSGWLPSPEVCRMDGSFVVIRNIIRLFPSLKILPGTIGDPTVTGIAERCTE